MMNLNRLKKDNNYDIYFFSNISDKFCTRMRISKPEESDSKRLVVLAGDRESGDTCRTFIFHKENHTLGNALRHVLLMNPRVMFAGYSIPHPAEDQMHLRIQTVEDYPAQEALKQALHDLKSLATVSKQKFLEAASDYKQQNPNYLQQD